LGTNIIKEEKPKPSSNNLKIISPISPSDFEGYYHLRWKILRKPWDHPPGSEKDGLEDSCFHFMAVDNNNVVKAVCRVQKNSPSEGQIRFMAVDTDMQGKGVGSEILKAAEKTAKENGINVMMLHSRENALNFYKKNGYTLLGESYLLWGEIQHYLMKKIL
jgi:predicted GNAT family N-acyltransferase